MKISRVFFIGLLASFLVWAGKLYAEPESPVLISYKSLIVTQYELDEFLKATLSDDVLNQLKNDEGRMRKLILDYFTTRALAYEAREIDLDKDNSVKARLNYEADKVLGGLYLDRLSASPNLNHLENIAYEQYLANSERYRLPEQVSVSHILVDESNADETVKVVDEILQRINQGENFSELALRYSDDKSVEANKGDLGYFSRGEMVPEFEDAAFSMNEVGEIKGPVKTQFGMHIIRFNGRKESRTLPFEDVKEQLMSQAERQHINNQKREIVQSILNSDQVKTYHDSVNAYIAP